MIPQVSGASRVETARRQLGRYVFGLGAILYGAVDLISRQSGAWQQIAPLNHLPASAVLMLFLLVAAVELAGGMFMCSPQPKARTTRAGALALAGAYLVITALTLPDVAHNPAVFNSWGNLGEELSRLAGAGLALVMTQPEGGEAWRVPLARAAYWVFALCVVSFMIEQWTYFAPTVALVPRWLPPGQVFWAAATTIAFGLAALALMLAPVRLALGAARLLTAMLVGFGALVWVPILLAHPHVVTNWTETAETLSIAGAAWIVADYQAIRFAR